MFLLCQNEDGESFHVCLDAVGYLWDLHQGEQSSGFEVIGNEQKVCYSNVLDKVSKSGGGTWVSSSHYFWWLFVGRGPMIVKEIWNAL